MIKQIFCTECLETVNAEKISATEVFEIKGEAIEVESTYFQCPICGEMMYDTENPSENLEKAYNEYRLRKKLLMPEEIISIREKYGFSQRQLARLLGWSHATISKYESGALPIASHNNTLTLLKDPSNVQKLLERNKDNLTESEVEELRTKVVTFMQENRTGILSDMFENVFSINPNEFSGYQKFNMDKLVQMVKFFANKDKNLYKIKLLKYLFYADFLSFKRYTVSISGLKYLNLPMGPVPNDYDILLGLVTKTDEVDQAFIKSGYPNPAEKFEADGNIDYSLFSDDELETMEFVLDKLKHHSSASISELSHSEIAWRDTNHVKEISYRYASDLSLE